MTDDSLGIFDAGDTHPTDDPHRSVDAGGRENRADRRGRRRAPGVPVLPPADIDSGGIDSGGIDSGDIDSGGIDGGDIGRDIHGDEEDDEVDLDAVRAALSSTAGVPQVALPAQHRHKSVIARDRRRHQLLAARRRRRRRRR
ncbi:MAG: hypothetical protein M3Z00_05175, partial [Actinomycetota bacterium]|nr:hypothetical protein [Actinomycetota bacterium]